MKLPKKLAFYAASLFTFTSLSLALNWAVPTALAASRDCDNNAIINCGALTASELKSKYTANATGDLDNVFSHYGISSTMVSGATSAKTGTVTKDGRVIVDGKTVATGAQSVGRQNISGSTAVTIGGKTYYQRPTSVSFNSSSLEAFVFVDANGKFVAAVIKSCGNPVKATPVVVPPKPQPPAPAASCSSLTRNSLSRERHTFTATATTSNGATISKYTFVVRENSATGAVVQTSVVTTTARTATTSEMTFAPGTYVVIATVTTSVGEKTTSGCMTSFTVAPLPPKKVEVCNPASGQTIVVDESQASQYKPIGDEACKMTQVCNPATGQTITVKASEVSNYKPVGDEACQPKVQGVTALPSTGPTEMIGGGIGLTSLAAAGYYWRASRRDVLRSLMNR